MPTPLDVRPRRRRSAAADVASHVRRRWHAAVGLGLVGFSFGQAVGFDWPGVLAIVALVVGLEMFVHQRIKDASDA